MSGRRNVPVPLLLKKFSFRKKRAKNVMHVKKLASGLLSKKKQNIVQGAVMVARDNQKL